MELYCTSEYDKSGFGHIDNVCKYDQLVFMAFVLNKKSKISDLFFKGLIYRGAASAK